MFGVGAAETLPRVHHETLLKVIYTIIIIDPGVPASFVAVSPHYYRRMIAVALHYLADKPPGRSRVILLLPATQLVDNQQSYRIAYLKKLFVRRIMRHPHRIHVHLFYKAGIAKRYVARQRTATLRPETMTVDTLENNTASV